MIAPIDECYALVGAVKMNWEGISGGAAIERAVPAFFERLRTRRGAAVTEPLGAIRRQRRAASAAARGRGRHGERGAPETSAIARPARPAAGVIGVGPSCTPPLRPSASARGRATTRAARSSWRALRSRSRSSRRSAPTTRSRRRSSPSCSASRTAGRPRRSGCSGRPRACWCRPSRAAPRSRSQVLCNYDVELAAAKYFHSVTDGEIPLAFHFNGSIYYSGDEGRLQIVQVPWDTVADFRCRSRSGGR